MEPGRDRRWTAAELIAEALGLRLTATPRLLEDWTRKGLIDQPEVLSRGRYGRLPGTWNWLQRDLFLFLLDERQVRKVRRDGDLANYPVFWWLVLDDEHISSEQVRRALSTWADDKARTPADRAERQARRDVALLAQPSTSQAARRRLRNGLVSWRLPRVDEAPALHEVIARLSRPVTEPAGLPAAGPPEAPRSSDAYAEEGSRVARAAAKIKADEVPEGAAYDARDLYRAERSSYFATWELWQAAGQAFAEHPEPTGEEVISHACHDLLLCLDIVLDASDWRANKPKRNNREIIPT